MGLAKNQEVAKKPRGDKEVKRKKIVTAVFRGRKINEGGGDGYDGNVLRAQEVLKQEKVRGPADKIGRTGGMGRGPASPTSTSPSRQGHKGPVRGRSAQRSYGNPEGPQLNRIPSENHRPSQA